jgi:small subunit ribosomal protein S9
LLKGKEESVVNNMPITEYFPGKISTHKWSKPLRLTDTFDKYYVTVRVVGGGKEGQLDAVTHGIAKALNKLDKDKYRPILKPAGLLTRDARIRERRKVDMGGKARRKRQSPKR